MDKFLRELESGEIHLRDCWQFELKTEYIPHPSNLKNAYTQEFYIFTPNSLQINKETYSKQQFYNDQSNFIRYKTPVFSLSELINPTNQRSPIYRILAEEGSINDEHSVVTIEDELKLLGNIARSSFRKEIFTLAKILKKGSGLTLEEVSERTNNFLSDIKMLKNRLLTVKTLVIEKSNNIPLKRHVLYVEEFISNSIIYYLTGFLQLLRKENKPEFLAIDEAVADAILIEKSEQKGGYPDPGAFEKHSSRNEFIFYRASLLNKYILDALLLHINRSTPENAIKNIIGSLAAGVAMLIYFVLFIWQGQVFVLNSEPFILATVVLYILKDRLKESLKTVSYEKAFKWLSDYTTVIQSPNMKKSLGTLKESFSFVDIRNLPEEIVTIRNKEFHYILEDFPRPESVIHYKKKVVMKHPSQNSSSRRFSLNMIFRFNILHFISKADNPYQTFWNLDPETKEFVPLRLPKVYHVNIIVKNSFLKNDGEYEVQLKKFRLILDKNGIKRVERVS